MAKKVSHYNLHQLGEYFLAMHNLKLSKIDLEKITFKKFKRMINFAYYNVPFYKKSFKTNNLHPSDIKTPGDIKKIPIVKKSTVVKNYNEIIARRVKGIYFHSTSGTSGLPLKMQYDKNYLISDAALLFRHLNKIGYNPLKKFQK